MGYISPILHVVSIGRKTIGFPLLFSFSNLFPIMTAVKRHLLIKTALSVVIYSHLLPLHVTDEYSFNYEYLLLVYGNFLYLALSHARNFPNR